MPKLTSLTETSREAASLEAFRLIETGTSVESACKQVGLTIGQYYFWISRSAESIEAIKAIISENERSIIAEISTARTEAIRRIVQAAHDEYNTNKLMQIESHLREIQHELEDKYGVSSMDRSASDFILSGPSTKPQESRTSISVEPTRKGITLNITSPDIIDLDAEDIHV